MSPQKAFNLKSEQQILSSLYSNKWNRIALSTDRVHPGKATAAVNSVYQLIGQSQPNILFFDSPIDFINSQTKSLSTLTEKNLEIGKSINKFLYRKLISISQQVGWGLKYQISQQIFNPLKVKLLFIKDAVINYLINNCFTRVNANYIKNNIWLEYLAKIDFFISVLNCQDYNQDWQIFLSLLSECGWIFPLEDTCIVCDRPNLIFFDHQNRLHAEGKPAIQYSSKYNIYAYHGVNLPEKYGRLHPHQWETQWLLTEPNAELRRVLIQGIG